LKEQKDKTQSIVDHIGRIADILQFVEDKEFLLKYFSMAFPIKLFWIDKKGTIIDFFTPDEKTLYIPPDKILGKSVREILPPQAAEKLAKAGDEARKNNKYILGEFQLPFPNTDKIYEMLCVPLKNGNLFLVIRDKTEIKLIEQDLKESGETYKSLAEESPNMIFINDRGRITYVNALTETVMGYTKEEFYSKDFDFLCTVAPEYRDRVKEVYAKKMKGEELESYEYELLLKNGSRLAALINTKVIHQGGHPVLLGIITVIEKRKRAEEGLREKTEFLEGVLNNVSDGIFVLDENPNYVYINEECGKIIGLNPKDWIGKRAGLALHPDDMEKTLSFFMRVIGGEKSRFEARLRGADGTYRTLDIKLSPMTWAGKRHILGVVTNVSERKKAERLLRERARDEVYGFLASALPVFAAGVPSNVRATMVATFADRFETNMRPKFQKEKDAYLKEHAKEGTTKDDPNLLLKGYLGWLKGYFSNLGVVVETKVKDDKGTLELVSCPWMAEAKGNPVFCLLCRAIVLRSFVWTGLGGASVQKTSIAGGEKCCRFEFNILNKGGEK
jgi:PAS domain S-box-containing protein